MAIILQPCANQHARKHYVDTIENTRTLNSIKKYLNDQELNELQAIYPQGCGVAIWGVTPSQSTQWEKIQAGDITLLAKEGAVFASAVTTYKVHNPSLASQLWGFDNKDKTWEYIYFLSEVKNQHIPNKEINKVIPYKENNNPFRNFKVLNEEQSNNLLSVFDLASSTFYPDLDITLINNEIENESSLDAIGVVKVRIEQPYLRKILFNNRPNSTCCICNKEYPVTFLWAAHIKKRAKCTLDEKKDIYNIAAPMCKFGCDDLYEKGYIGVKDGGVIQTKFDKLTVNLQSYIISIKNNRCLSWNDKTRQYFEWHLNQHKQ
jgi:hypothetical protein